MKSNGYYFVYYAFQLKVGYSLKIYRQQRYET